MLTSTVTDVIRNRRTIKPAQMSSREIDRDVLNEILENANWAPTHGMTQPWRFRVFAGESRQGLAEFLAATYKDLTDESTFKPKKYEAFKINPTIASVVIAVGMKRQESEKITELDELLAVGCAVQNMHLTAAAHGLGGFWSTNVAAVSDAMRDFTGLGSRDRALGLFYLGHLSCDGPQGTRESIDDRVSWA